MKTNKHSVKKQGLTSKDFTLLRKILYEANKAQLEIIHRDIDTFGGVDA